VGRAESGAPKKKNPAVGTPGQTFVVIGVYGFKYAAWLSFSPLESGESDLFFLYSQKFFSCSSIFLFFYNVPKFNRTLCDFASFSVRLRTHSSLGGDAILKARPVPLRK
jgi:hypothetical protein